MFEHSQHDVIEKPCLLVQPAFEPCHFCFLSGLDLTHQGTSVKGNSLIVKGVVAIGSVTSHAGKVGFLFVILWA